MGTGLDRVFKSESLQLELIPGPELQVAAGDQAHSPAAGVVSASTLCSTEVAFLVKSDVTQS